MALKFQHDVSFWGLLLSINYVVLFPQRPVSLTKALQLNVLSPWTTAFHLSSLLILSSLLTSAHFSFCSSSRFLMEGIRIIPLGSLLIQPVFDQRWGHMVQRWVLRVRPSRLGLKAVFPKQFSCHRCLRIRARHCA